MLALLQGCRHYVALTQAAQRFQIDGGRKPIQVWLVKSECSKSQAMQLRSSVQASQESRSVRHGD
jgi:hypothetical protein